jgi:hypothetical protein
MGCYCTKNSETKIIRPKKLSNRQLNFSHLIGPPPQDENIESCSQKLFLNNNARNKLILRRNMFFYIQKKMWIKILDFLSYRDLCQAGLLNK